MLWWDTEKFDEIIYKNRIWHDAWTKRHASTQVRTGDLALTKRALWPTELWRQMRWWRHSSYLTTRNRTKDTLISDNPLQSDALPTELWWGDIQSASPNAPLSTMAKQAILNQVNKRFLENPYTTWFQLISQQVPFPWTRPRPAWGKRNLEVCNWFRYLYSMGSKSATWTREGVSKYELM